MFNTNIKLSLCRTCLSTLSPNNTFNIFNTLDLAKKLMLCSALPVEVSDEYPENVCLQCYEQISLFYEFQQMCCKSLDKFNELLKIKEVAKEETHQQNEVKVACEANDPLKDELNIENHLKGESSNSVDNSICKMLLERKKRGRPSKKKLEDNIPKRYQEGKITGKGEIQKANSTNIFKEPVELQARSAMILEIARSSSHEVCKEEIAYTHCLKNEDRNNELNSKDQFNTEEKMEEKTHTDTESCNSSSPELSSPQKRCHQCDRCSENFTALHRLEAHKRQHDSLPPYICSINGCERVFNRWHFFNKHQKEHKLEQGLNYKCDIDDCQRIYKNKSALNVHKRKFHHYGPELKSHMCEVCGKVFKSSAVLNDHRYTHIDKTQLPYACEEEGCTKRFSNKEKLKIHKIRHAGIKNFICPFCGMRKTTRNELKIHINYHTLERTWPCRFCPKVCNSAGNLKMHVKNIHERARDFACRFCEKTFAKADTKKYHEMTHTGEKPHECEECGRRFLQPAALRTHRKIHLRQKGDLKEKDQCGIGRETNDVKNSVVEAVEEVSLTEAMVADILGDTNENLE